jgi:hypothetical protein
MDKLARNFFPDAVGAIRHQESAADAPNLP